MSHKICQKCKMNKYIVIETNGQYYCTKCKLEIN